MTICGGESQFAVERLFVDVDSEEDPHSRGAIIIRQGEMNICKNDINIQASKINIYEVQR